MTTSKRQPAKPANPAAISRFLGSKGFDRSETHPSRMVRGWATFTRGFTSTAVMDTGRRRVRQGSYRDGSPRYGWISDNTPTGVVQIEWTLGDAGRNVPMTEKVVRMGTRLDAITAVLTEAGYHVERRFYGVYGVPSLLVSRRDQDGDVIR